MIIHDFNFYPFSIKLKSKFINATFNIAARNGFIIKITDENDLVGYGEVSPLPGFSKETFEEAEIALNKLYYSILEKASKKETYDLSTELITISYLPSLLFGFEQAIISLLVQRGELDSLLTAEKRISIAGLVDIKSKEETLKNVDNLLAEDFKTIKIKLGKNTVEKDVALVKTITQRIDDSIKIRLDINGNWNYEQAEFAVNNLPMDKIEFIEQPVNNINELVMLSDFSPIPIAVDESIENMSEAKNLIELSNIQVIVLKPSILGSIIKAISLIKVAEKMNKKIIISSAFESVVGRSALVLLASLVKGNHAHGLNTAKYFEKDLAADNYPIVDSLIYFNPVNYPPYFKDIEL
ncbi:MAG: o-succinylbenzoate synthase [Bacteroidetes bacterium]|nr:o-succinylbenzoate synthase [Bacteroidota bacterium]MBU1115855.1 o-succinylbenzoate synthase [Bacteroidota bacterium]MBU1797969.1 o-succinylbenzoate synthase [Bacteroidota bacterium]